MLKLASPTPICKEADLILATLEVFLPQCRDNEIEKLDDMLHAQSIGGMTEAQVSAEWKSNGYLCTESANSQHSVACFCSRLPH